MDIVAATFPEPAEAASAASALTSELHIDPDLVTVSPVRATPPDPVPAATARVVLVAWIGERDRAIARDVLGRHHGRHVPFDWLADPTGVLGAP